MTISTIMVPIDLSQHSSVVLPYAAALAEHHGATLLLAHVALGPVEKAQAEMKLEEMAAAAGLRHYRCCVEVGHGPAAVASMAAACAADLVVVASHGRGGLARALVGSTTAGLIRTAPCPVLVLKHPGVILEATPQPPIRFEEGPRVLRQSPPTAEDEYFARQDRLKLEEARRTQQDKQPQPVADLQLRTILVATDFGAAASGALQTARALANSYGARLLLLHVVSEDLPPEETEQTAAVAFERLESMAGDAPGTSFRVVSGPAADRIAAAAAEDHVDLLVMGTGNHQGLWRFLLGSNAEAVMYRVTCPLLVVREGVPVEASPRALATESSR